MDWVIVRHDTFRRRMARLVKLDARRRAYVKRWLLDAEPWIDGVHESLV